MIYLSISTKNRFWHCALTLLSLINSGTPRCFVHVLDEASDEDVEDRVAMFEDLILRKLIHRYDYVQDSIGFCGSRAKCYDTFMKIVEFDYWIQLDDDLVIGSHLIEKVYEDYRTHMYSQGLLHIFPNPWCTLNFPHRGPMSTVPKAGGCAFIVSKNTLKVTGANPFYEKENTEEGNAAFWEMLKNAGFSMMIRSRGPYPIQHTGNENSVIFGRQPNWEPFWQKDFYSNRIVDVPPYSIAQLRVMLKQNKLPQYVRMYNAKLPVKLKLGVNDDYSV